MRYVYSSVQNALLKHIYNSLAAHLLVFDSIGSMDSAISKTSTCQELISDFIDK